MVHVLNDEQSVTMRDIYAAQVGMSKDRPCWVGLMYDGQEVVTRRICPVDVVTPRRIQWASRELKVPKMLPGRKWWQHTRIANLRVITSGTPAGIPWTLCSVDCYPGGLVVVTPSLEFVG